LTDKENSSTLAYLYRFCSLILGMNNLIIKTGCGLWLRCLTPLSTNISVISCRSVLLVEETGVPGENHRPVASHWQTLSHNVVPDKNMEPKPGYRRSDIWIWKNRYWNVELTDTRLSWNQQLYIQDHIADYLRTTDK
jgi:hypothetical protein